MRKRVGDIEEFTIERLTEEENQALHCVLCVSGWIEDREPQAFRTPWRHLWMSKEQYTLRWESKVKIFIIFFLFSCLYSIWKSLVKVLNILFLSLSVTRFSVLLWKQFLLVLFLPLLGHLFCLDLPQLLIILGTFVQKELPKLENTWLKFCLQGLFLIKYFNDV